MSSTLQLLNLPEEAEISMEAVYTASSTSQKVPYLLYDSFILDSGVTVHICNNRQWFENFVMATDYFIAEDSQVRIEGYRTVHIKLS